MTDKCDFVDPTTGWACGLDSVHSAHECREPAGVARARHAAGDHVPRGCVTIPIPDFKVREAPRTTATKVEEKKTRDIARETGYAIARKSSLLYMGPLEREVAKEKAGKHVEPEFVDAVWRCVREMQTGTRFITEDIWKWCDEREIFTDHPRGIGNILKKIAHAGLIEVPEDELVRPDNSRTNKSRQLQVYVRT